MSTDAGSETPWIFQGKVSREDVRQKYKYRKTRKFYEGVIQRGQMIRLQDLDTFPAPVVCSYCEKAVITRTETERSSAQIMEIGINAAVTAGMLTYFSWRTARNIFHECPECHFVLAILRSDGKSGWREAKVINYYNNDGDIPASDKFRPVRRGSQILFQSLSVHIGNQVNGNQSVNDGMNLRMGDGSNDVLREERA